MLRECFDSWPPSPNGRHDASLPRDPGERRRVSCPFSKGLQPRPLQEVLQDSEEHPLDQKAQCRAPKSDKHSRMLVREPALRRSLVPAADEKRGLS